MAVAGAALAALNLSQMEGAKTIGIAHGSMRDIASGRRGARLSADGWRRLGGLFAMVEQAADEIIADQAELDGGQCIVPLALEVDRIPLDTRELRELAAARAMFVLGPDLLTLIEEPAPRS